MGASIDLLAVVSVDPMQNVYAVILAGGSGTRFWPASRRARPKQLLPIGPDAGRSLIAATVDRVRGLCPPERILIATGESLLEATRAALPDLPASSFLGEPAARNTAACIGWASALVRRRDPEAVVMVLPSDHHIADPTEFEAVVGRALASAMAGTVTTIGISPTRPETGYGYLELGDVVTPGVHRVARFVEKPTRDVAEGFLASGRYLWNGGMFFFRADQMLAAITAELPALAAGLARIEAAAAQGGEAEATVTREVFAALPSVSIDHGVMEKLDRIHVVPGAFGWSDVGSWESAWELGQKDADGNVVGAGTLALASRNTLVQRLGSGRRVVVAVGVEDLCIVDTDDAVLIIPRQRAQDVRLAVERLREQGDEELI